MSASGYIAANFSLMPFDTTHTGVRRAPSKLTMYWSQTSEETYKKWLVIKSLNRCNRKRTLIKDLRHAPPKRQRPYFVSFQRHNDCISRANLYIATPAKPFGSVARDDRTASSYNVN